MGSEPQGLEWCGSAGPACFMEPMCQTHVHRERERADRHEPPTQPARRAPAAPISLLLALPDSKENTEILMGVVDAMRSGARWQLVSTKEQRWSLARAPERPSMLWLRMGVIDVRRPTDPLPNLLGTGEAADAAAYRMESRELGDWSTSSGLGHAFMWCVEDDGGWPEWKEGPWHRDRKVAACMAVCAKLLEHPEIGPLCRVILERLSK